MKYFLFLENWTEITVNSGVRNTSVSVASIWWDVPSVSVSCIWWDVVRCPKTRGHKAGVRTNNPIIWSVVTRACVTVFRCEHSLPLKPPTQEMLSVRPVGEDLFSLCQADWPPPSAGGETWPSAYRGEEADDADFCVISSSPYRCWLHCLKQSDIRQWTEELL